MEPPRAPRPSRQGLSTRVSFGHVVMIVAGLLAFVIVASVLRSQDATVAVAVARHDIAAGAPVRLSDVKAADLPADSSLLGTLARLEDVKSSSGARAGRAIRAGHPLTKDDLRPEAASDGRRAMSIPIDEQHAAGGQLAVGDRVDVIAVDKQTGEPTFVLDDAEVIGVSSGKAGGIGGVSKAFHVTVAVTAPESLALAAAIRHADVEVVRSTGAPPAQG